MSTLTTSSILPNVPVKHADFIPYLQSNPEKPLSQLLEPYKEYDAKLREVFAQEPNHPALKDPYINVVPVFGGYEKDLKIRARDLDAETIEEKERYVMSLDPAERRPNGSPAIVGDLKDFQQNFALFCESSLVDMDWSNVVAAGSAVVTCLLPIPPKHNKSKKTLRQYYHDIIAPASDVDLFLYGLSEEEATQKIIQIEQRIKDSILTETTTIRTKNAITIASQYPTRHVQIVLRLYKSVSEILTGFDVDCSCAAYDGQNVWASPRALTAYMTQMNTIDLTRRSPSYENRLSKYSHRGFEVYWKELERKRIDPTIYERNFARTVGLARLLVLERLPTKSEREAYMDERRAERGRPAINRFSDFSNNGNIKDKFEDEVAEWVDAEDVSDYHTFTIPYGAQFHAKKIEKLLYTKDLLLNAEWNKRDDREVNLHRHPAFFGYAEDVIKDCCGFCPKPVTPEEHDVAEEESKIYVSGEISFIKDDAGRQAIGSFHPITDDDWTEMAYIGNTARLCQAIIDSDLEHVEDWLEQEGSDPNCRDHTGRTPLHLAVTSSSPEVVKALIERGARLVARLADGRTALHLASARGNVEIVKMILQKSEENEEEESNKEDIRKQARITARKEQQGKATDVDKKHPESDAEDSDGEMVEKDDSDDDVHSATTGSYMKVKDPEKKVENLNIPEDENEDEPDVYDVNVLTWDSKCSPLHYAILNGHINVVKELVQGFGADPLLPIKLLHSHDKSPRGAILTLVLALRLPLEKARAMTQALLEIGASSAQANTNQTTALHFISGQQPEIIETLFEFDEPAAKRAINHLSVMGSSWSPSAASPLMSAISSCNSIAALKLLEAGAEPHIVFKDWMKSVETQYENFVQRDSKFNHDQFVKDIEQPIVLAIQKELPEIALALLAQGADVNTLPKSSQQGILNDWYRRYNKMESLLELVQNKLQTLRSFQDENPPTVQGIKLRDSVDYLQGIEPGTYKYFTAQVQLEGARESDKQIRKNGEDQLARYNEREGIAEKKEAVEALAMEFEKVEKELIEKGAKTFKELYPDVVGEKIEGNSSYPYPSRVNLPWEVSFDFEVHDLTDDTREAYLKLYQATWDGDLATIKSLTLAPWGPSNDQTPLKITVTDGNNQSPFSLAILRGHFDVARAIIEISYAQYSPDEKKEKARYRLGNVPEVDDYDEDTDEDASELASEASETSDVPVYKEIVDDKFVIDIGEAVVSVKSKISPLTFLSWTCSSLWAYVKYCSNDRKFTYGLDNKEIENIRYGVELSSWAIITNDLPLFSLMLDLKLEWPDRLNKGSESVVSFPTFSQGEFELAIQYSRLDLLAEMIKHGGAGMKLDSLVKQSGVKFQEKSEFYQGLSVHGKKMAKWISAARGTRTQSIRDAHPPLLQAAFRGSLASVEFFMGDVPTRHYRDFAEAYKHDKLITHLNEAGGGFDKTLLKWLGARRDLALHCAVMAEPKPETIKLIEYLLRVMPDSLELKSKQGHTPLALAFSLGRMDVVKLLIAAGADQTVRDSDGANILHLILCSAYTSSSPDEETLKKSLELIDKRLIGSLLSERSSHQPGSLTPLARWLQRGYGNENILSIMLEFGKSTGNEHLEHLDGSGDTPLHRAVKSRNKGALNMILKYRPDLLYRENSVGRTPYEVAEDAFIAQCVCDVPVISGRHRNSIVDQATITFAKNFKDNELVDPVERVWRLCENFAKEHPGKRRLVSLLDANEVAKRLANRHAGRRNGGGNDNGSDVESDDGNMDDAVDEVAQWYSSAPPNPSEKGDLEKKD
ncbi:ankyrin [Melanomma pulvis-pyrius CBS 109.77]|uniref:Ankyrin n=1 Tax=Melanomma pulvis-pyrius CBS 109.77 TaxID=1314802 RepID=A0A6A6X4U5_9PLEO|nr:ankyrin [Melanomma pulvis-pyrius CBS 109.77]